VGWVRHKPLPDLARIPYAEGDMEWLRDDRRSKTNWCAQFRAWETPTAWFDSVIKLALRRCQEVYAIQLCGRRLNFDNSIFGRPQQGLEADLT
jgi:hypothetical protein